MPLCFKCLLPLKSQSNKMPRAFIRSRSLNLQPLFATTGGGGRGDSHMKGAGMLVVSLGVVNFGFWSHSRYSGQNAIIFSCKGLSQDSTRIFSSFYSLHSCNQSLKWSHSGVKKGWATPILVSFRGLIQNFLTNIPAPFISSSRGSAAKKTTALAC